jgi:dinuclear metal center YbgI/SA1388 family protein
MIKRDQLTQFIYQTLGENLLAKAAKVDTAPNNIQLRGIEKVDKIVFGVSASLEFIEQAIASKAQYLVVHHGLHFDGHVLRGRLEPYEQRLRLIFQNDLTLAGFHFVLDAHPKLGNNARIIEKIGAKRKEPYFDDWGWIAELDNPIKRERLADKLSKILQHDIFAVYAGPQEVKRIGVCSGGAKPKGEWYYEIIDKNIHAHITGDISESGPYLAEEGGFNYLAGGHYATEVFGVQALADEVKKKFGDKLDVEFLDIPSTL